MPAMPRIICTSCFEGHRATYFATVHAQKELLDQTRNRQQPRFRRKRPTRPIEGPAGAGASCEGGRCQGRERSIGGGDNNTRPQDTLPTAGWAKAPPDIFRKWLPKSASAKRHTTTEKRKQEQANNKSTPIDASQATQDTYYPKTPRRWHSI